MTETVLIVDDEESVRRTFKEWLIGSGLPVRVFAVAVEGYDDPWFLVTTSATLTAAEGVAVFAAR